MKSNEQYPYDYNAIQKLANSETGKKLIQLVQSRGGQEMEEALNRAAQGNYTQALQILQRIIPDSDVSRLKNEMEDGNERIR